HGAIDSMTLEEAYTFESDLIISGEPKLSLDDPRYLTGDGFLKGGVILKISQLGVHFVGAPAVSPDPLDIEVGVEDSNGKYWPYRVQEREQLNMINFALPVPMYDEETEFHFRIMNAPGNSNITGSVEFKFFIDSTAPSLGDFKYSIIEDGVVLDWAFIEKGSGLNKDDVMYSLNIVDGIPGDWIGSGEISVNKRRMSFKIQMDGSNHKDVELAIQLTDVVGNRLYSDHDYHITFDPTPDHDLVIGQEVDFSPDPVIVNQVIHFRSTIINKGSMDENDILVEVMRDGGLVSRINIPFLAAGSTREIRWQWKAVEGLSMFKLIIDPYNTVDDLCPQNNERSFEISSDYLDVFVKDDTVFFSDEEAENMDLISISFNIGSIGSIESGPIKIILRQDEKFL
ncbi:MAG: CARDB domain-containing protein, partial [Candidatus Thermoplasmatota archaeon]|nr:CARDB domain-containing protein [Candidatus Thermoplasmatota archaeon]